EAGSYSRASSVYRQLATRFSGREQTLSLYPAGQTDETSRGITVRPAQDGENQVYFDGGAYARVLDVRISRLAVARAEQSEFLSRSGVENPFDLGQVRNYILSLPPEAVAEELETYLSAFYFHIGSDVPDDANLSAVMAYPQNIIGQRPVDCRVFAQITRHVLTPGWLTRVANFFGGRQSPYQFHDVYTTQVHYGVQHTDSGHQLLLVESSAGAFMLNNDQVIQLENGSEEQIRTALAGIMESHGYVLTDPNDLPMTHFVVLDDGEQLTGSLFEDASPIVGADVPAVAVDGSDEPAAGNASLIGEG
ncbi:MAG: hypothetical protein JW782_03000, partial [Candidatus Saganbacteria bacterium]|nr:hypothetical protein [Candidatus Saganbacteria bacterium]